MKNLDVNRSKAGLLSEANKLEAVRKAIRQKRKDIISGELISLAEGGCLLPPPPNVLKASFSSMSNLSKYPINTYPRENFSHDYLDKIAWFLDEHFHIKNTQHKQICLGFGVTHLFDLFIAATCHEDDVIIAPEGYYHSFAELPTKWGVSLVNIPTRVENSYKMTPDDFENWWHAKKNEKTKSKVKSFMFSNPTVLGAIYSENELKELAQCLSKYGIAVFEDRVFYKTEFNAENKTPSILKYMDLDKDHAFTAYSASKVIGAANFRVGFGYGSPEIASLIDTFFHDSVLDPPFFIQVLGQAMLDMPEKYISVVNQENEKRKDLVVSEVKKTNARLKKIFSVDYDFIEIPFEPLAAQYVLLKFNKIKDWIMPSGKRMKNNLDLTDYFLSLKANNQVKGVLLSSGYSKGHDDFSHTIAFAQLGCEVVAKEIECQTQRAGKSFYWELDDYDYEGLEPAFNEGRNKIVEAIQRLEYGISQLSSEIVKIKKAA